MYSLPSAPSASTRNPLVSGDPEADDSQFDTPIADATAGSADGATASTVRSDLTKSKVADGTDGADAKIPPDSAPHDNWEIEV